MVKVVGHDPAAVKRTTCQNCAAVLEYTGTDVRERHGKDYSGGASGREWIQCPQCNDEVVINSW